MPNLFEMLDKLITEHGSASIQKVHIDLLRDQAKALVDENVALKARASELEEINRNLLLKLEEKQKDEQFTEHQGMLFKRDIKGEWLETVYCPKCHGPMGAGFNDFPFQCLSCKVIASFNPGDLKRKLIPELKKLHG